MKVITKSNGKTRCYFTDQEHGKIEYVCGELYDHLDDMRSKAAVDIIGAVLQGYTQGLSVKQLDVIRSVAEAYQYYLPDFFTDFEGTPSEWRERLVMYGDCADQHEINQYKRWYGEIVDKPKSTHQVKKDNHGFYDGGAYDG